MTPLRQQMIDDMTARGFAKATHNGYLHAVTELARFHGKSPDQLTPREVQCFLVHLVQERGFAWATCNSYVHALRFFYRVTLEGGRVAIEERIDLKRRIRDVVQTPDGAILVIVDDAKGDLLRLTPTAARPEQSVR